MTTTLWKAMDVVLKEGWLYRNWLHPRQEDGWVRRLPVSAKADWEGVVVGPLAYVLPSAPIGDPPCRGCKLNPIMVEFACIYPVCGAIGSSCRQLFDCWHRFIE
ncbi:hypothetical protein GOP47_0004834 [Adiantum capillus-veneris]|uniref:Uncharacterized protein n=1 Tax=Adiantum capillus-veneris TaxID=13818 RepID=A0A9D4V4J9_ADICA|nr:hypothetical protein GOP47_0004834 [Adiantum capillus-veneris]